MIGALIPRYRKLIPYQLADLEAMDQVGVRRDAHAQTKAPTVSPVATAAQHTSALPTDDDAPA